MKRVALVVGSVLVAGMAPLALFIEESQAPPPGVDPSSDRRASFANETSIHIEVGRNDLALEVTVPQNVTGRLDWTRVSFAHTSDDAFAGAAVYDLLDGVGIVDYRGWWVNNETRVVVQQGGPGPAVAGPDTRSPVMDSGATAPLGDANAPFNLSWNLEPGLHRILLGTERASFVFDAQLVGLPDSTGYDVVDLGPDAFRMLSTQVRGDFDRLEQTSIMMAGTLVAETTIQTHNAFGRVSLVTANQNGLISIETQGQPTCSSRGGAVVGIHSLFLNNAPGAEYVLAVDGVPSAVMVAVEPQAVATILDVPGITGGERRCT